jgi:maltose O-acetyltransferase
MEKKLFWVCKKKILKMIAKSMPINRIRIALYRRCGYKIGEQVYIGEDLIISDLLHDSNNITIGDRVSMGPRVTLITASSPNFSKIRPYIKSIEKGKIKIENDAWIGACVTILPNIVIGEGAVVGAGSVVTKDVQPFTIVVGVPAKIIGKIEVENENQTNINT